MLPVKKDILFLFMFFQVLCFATEQENNRKDSLMNKIAQTRQHNLLADYYNELSLLTYSEDANLSATWARKALQLPEKSTTPRQKADALAYLGRALSRLNKPDSAIMLYTKSIAYYKESQDTFLTARMYNAIGTKYMDIGLYPQALESMYEALKLLENLGTGYERGMASLLNNMGNIHYYQKNYELALEHYKKSHKLIHIHQDTFIIANTYNNIGIIHEANDEFEKALDYYNKAIDAYQAVGAFKLQANTLYNKGVIAIRQNKTDTAERHFKECLILGSQHNSLLSAMLGYSGLTITAVKRNNVKQANNYADTALILIDSLKHTEAKIDIYTQLFNLYRKVNQNDEALRYHLQLTSLKDSLYSIEKNKQIEELKTRYQTEKKEQEIALLKQQKEQEETRKSLWLVIFILTSLLALFIIYTIVIKNRKKVALLQKEKEMDRLKSQLFTNISHEFRTPLTLIKTPLEKLQYEETDIKKQKTYKLMHKHTQQLLRMVNQILDLAKIEAGKLIIHPKNHEVMKLLRRWTMSFQSLADSKGQKLAFSSSHAFLKTETDASALETIINNLVSNALKFEPEKGQVDVSCNFTESANQKQLYIAVRNYNSFIPQAELNRIFERYYRANENNQKEQPVTGTGIGLALVKELALLLKGDVVATSSKEAGTTFTLQIPLNVANTISQKTTAPGIPEKDQHEPAASTSGGVAKDMQHWMNSNNKENESLILVVEDNDDVREFILDSLKETGFKVISAKNGQEGIEMALKTIPDLIVSDVMMPLKDGYELCKVLKNDEKTSHIPIVLLTARASFESKIKGLKTLADDYLVKPFNTAELLTRIKNLIALRQKLQAKFSGILPSPAQEKSQSLDETFLKKIRQVVENQIQDEHFSVEELSQRMALSRSQLHRKLSAITGISPNQFIRNYRLEKAMQMLKSNSATAAEISFAVGFSSAAYFGKCFREYFNISPGEVRNTVG